jgi:toxin ParE1/3/4
VKRSIFWKRPALERLEEIASFIKKDNPLRAASFIEELIAAAEQIERFPFSGSIVPENAAFRQIVNSGYRIIYLILNDLEIHIVAVISPYMSGREIRK